MNMIKVLNAHESLALLIKPWDLTIC